MDVVYGNNIFNVHKRIVIHCEPTLVGFWLYQTPNSFGGSLGILPLWSVAPIGQAPFP
jgi:hypothetical protein